ncbi:MAG: RDD family protein [Saprospiraceae bacterium]|nr:RDD family protein [Saprospiraceae bacterium]
MQHIEITTTQNVTIEYELAGLRERFFALLIDQVIMFFLWMGLFFIFINALGFDSRFMQQVIMGFPIWFTILYTLSCESFLNGQTIGKRTQKIKVVRVDGHNISLSDLLLRALLLVMDYLFTFGALGALLISTTDKRQRLGDMAAGTTVIKIGMHRRFDLSDILNINTLDNYTPQYPQVKQLSEEDMLFIKSVILRYQQYRNLSHEEVVFDLYQHLKSVLEIKIDLSSPLAMIDFFKVLIKDYIVLTR